MRSDFSFFHNDPTTSQLRHRSSKAALEIGLDHATISVAVLQGVVERATLHSILQQLAECGRRVNEVWVVFLCVTGPEDIVEHESVAPRESSNGSGGCTLNEVCERIRKQPQYVVGMADGHVGNSGACLLAACDAVVASEEATFVFVQEFDVIEMVNLCLLRLVGSDVLQRLLETRGAIGAQMARYLGFVEYVVPSSHFVAEQALIRSKLGFYSDAQLRQSRENRCTSAGSMSSSDTIGRQEPSSSMALPPRLALSRALVIDQIGSGEANSSQAPLVRHTTFEPGFPLTDDSAFSLAAPGEALTSQETHNVQGNQESAKARGGSKKKDRVSQFSYHGGPITSLMLCNIPCRVTQEQLGQTLDELGFKDTYDFLYLPTASRSAKTTGSNLGYGFINFIDPCYPGPFKKAFTAYKFPGTSSQKVLGVKVAHVQGLAANMRNFGQGNATRTPLTLPSNRHFQAQNVLWEMSL